VPNALPAWRVANSYGARQKSADFHFPDGQALAGKHIDSFTAME